MSSGFSYRGKVIDLSNAIAELILAKLIKHSSDGSRLLAFALESYRGFWPGMIMNLEDVITGDVDRDEWKVAIARAIDDIVTSGDVSSDFSSKLQLDKHLYISLCG